MAHASNFHYKNLSASPTGQILRPIIPVEIHKKRQTVKYEMLLDTGADISIMSGEIGELLGIDIVAGRPHVITGVGGAVTGGYLHDIGITIPGQPTYNSWAFFSTELNDMQPGILGQLGFFENLLLLSPVLNATGVSVIFREDFTIVLHLLRHD